MPKNSSKRCCPDEPKKRFHGRADPKRELSTLAKALSHPIRIEILKLLKSRENCICGEIVDELPLAQATVSQHLKVLKEAGFIRGEVSGPKTCYCLEPRTLKRLKEMIQKL